ncbi:hydrolase [Aureococcus anophagefferens]|nr:hydrolase [Aureococcus anophagefferens]
MSSPSPKKRCPKPWRPLFAAGSRVECRHGGGDVFYPGVVTAVTSDGHYDVDYDDGDEERGVAGSLMRPEAGLKVGDALQKKFPGYGSGVFDGRVAEIFPAEKKAMDHPPSPAKPVKRAAASAPPAPLPALEAPGGRPKRARKAPPALTYAKMGTNTPSAKKRAWDSEEDASISSSDESAKPGASARPRRRRRRSRRRRPTPTTTRPRGRRRLEDESSDDASSEDEKPKRKRKAAAAKKKAPAAKKKAAAALAEAEKGTAGKPTAGLAPPMAGQYSGEYRFAIGTVVSVKCTSTGRWVRGHVIMHLRGGVTTFYAVEKARCLFERMQGKNQHYEDVDVTTQKAAAACVVALDEPPREVRKWTSGTPCMRAEPRARGRGQGAPFDPSLGFGASKLRTKQSTGKFSGGADAAAGLDEAEDRPNVTPDGKPVHGMCLGAVFVLGGVGMACSNARNADGNNIGPSYIRAIGDHSGGQGSKGRSAACSDDGVDLPYFTKYRIDKKEFDADENVKYFRYQRKRAIELPPPTKKNAVSVECYGLTMRGGGWMSHCDAAATRTVHELTPNMTGFHVLHLDASGAAGVALVESHADKKRFNIYAKTDPETDRFAKFVKGLKPNAVVAVCITDTANMEKIGYRFPFAFLGVKGAKPGSAVVLMDKTKFLLRIDATVVTAKDGTVTLADVAEEKTDITTKVILSKNHGDEG